MRSQIRRIVLFMCLNLALCLAASGPAFAQYHYAILDESPTLGRVTGINSVESFTLTAAQKLYLISDNYVDFDVTWKIEDNSRWRIHNWRARAEVERHVRLGSEEMVSVMWRQKEKESRNPYTRYKYQNPNPSWTGGDSIGEVPQGYDLFLYAEDGVGAPETRRVDFAVARKPSFGGELLVFTLLENETAYNAYGQFLDQMQEYEHGTPGKAAVYARLDELEKTAGLYMHHWDPYIDPTGAYSDIVLEALSVLLPLELVAVAVESIDMLFDYKEITEDLIEDCNDFLNAAYEAADMRWPMKEAWDVLRYRDPRSELEDLRAAMQDYAYRGSVSDEALVGRAETAIEAVVSYHDALIEAQQTFDDEVLSRPGMADKDVLRAFGARWFDHQRGLTELHLVALETLRVHFDPTCRSCESCFDPPAGGTPSSAIHIDYRDDTLVKKLTIDVSDIDIDWSNDSGSFTWNLALFGKALRSYSSSQRGVDVYVNGSRVGEFWPHDFFSTGAYSDRAVLQIPVGVTRSGSSHTLGGPFVEGVNTIKLRSQSHWDYNGIWVGRDPGSDCDLSAWDNNWNSNPSPSGDSGELMIYHVLVGQ